MNSSEDVFVETLQFTAFPDKEGQYTCCVSVLREQEDQPVGGSGWIDESQCGKHGTVTVEHGMLGDWALFAITVFVWCYTSCNFSQVTTSVLVCLLLVWLEPSVSF